MANRFLLTAALLIVLGGCAARTTYETAVKDQWAHFGKPVSVTSSDTLPLGSLTGVENDILLEAVVREVCQTKGCWMKVGDEAGHELFIRFQDYSFFVPRNAMGRRVLLHGNTEIATYSVADLQHLASDAGQSPEAIAAINEPKILVTFFADSVWIQGSGLIEPYRPVGQESCPPVPSPALQ